MRATTPTLPWEKIIDQVHVQDTLFRLTGVGVAQIDMNTGRFVRTNRTFCEMVGYSEVELKGMTYLELTHPDDRARDAESFAGLQRAEHEEDTSLTRVLHKDGTVAWLELHVTVIREGSEALNIAVINDVSERERAGVALRQLNETLEQRVEERTQALRVSEQRFSQAFYANPIPASLTTLGRETFVEVNNALLALSGYERDEVVGKSSYELGMWSSPEDRRKLEEAQRGGRGFKNLELELRGKEGGVYTVLMSAEIIQLSSEQGYLKMFYDITERKQTEQQLMQAVQSVMSDTAWFSQKIVEKMANVRLGEQNPAQFAELSGREREVLERLSRGVSNDVIAADLGIATQTVRNYISTIYDKLGVHSRAEAIVWARERGIS